MTLTIWLLSAVSFVVVAVMTVTVPLLPLVAEEFRITVGHAGIIVAAFALPYGAIQLFMGPLGDKFGKKKVIGGSLLLSTFFVFGSGLSHSIEALATMRFFSGIAMAGTIPLAMAYIADEVPYSNRQLILGKYISGVISGHIAGGVLGGLAAEFMDWRHIFFLFSGLCFVFSILLLQSRGEGASKKLAQFREPLHRMYWSMLADSDKRKIIITGTFEGMLIFGTFSYLGAFLKDSFDISFLSVGLILGMYGLGGIVYTATVSFLVPALGERKMIFAGSFFLGSCFLILFYITAVNIMFLLFFFMGFSFYLFHNTMQMKATQLSPDAQGVGVSFWAFMLFFGQGIGVFVFGILIDKFGYHPSFFFAGFSIILLGLWFQDSCRVKSDS